MLEERAGAEVGLAPSDRLGHGRFAWALGSGARTVTQNPREELPGRKEARIKHSAVSLAVVENGETLEE